MLKEIYQNNLAFYEMVKITSLLCNNSTEEYLEDARKIIDFVGKSFGLKDELISFCEKQILDDLTVIQTEEDTKTYRSLKQQEHPAVDVSNPLIKFKYNAIVSILDLTGKDSQLNKVWFDYSYPNDYNAIIRYSEIKSSASAGFVDINKTAAMLECLGIGIEASLSGAKRKFKQCMYWGDECSIRYLAQIAKQEGNKEEAAIYDELSTLSNLINDGITVLPKEMKGKISKKTNELFNIITSIKHDVIRRYDIRLIDYSFVEVMMDDEIDYAKKLGYINDYRSFGWAEETNSSASEVPNMGFKRGA